MATNWWDDPSVWKPAADTATASGNWWDDPTVWTPPASQGPSTRGGARGEDRHRPIPAAQENLVARANAALDRGVPEEQVAPLLQQEFARRGLGSDEQPSAASPVRDQGLGSDPFAGLAAAPRVGLMQEPPDAVTRPVTLAPLPGNRASDLDAKFTQSLVGNVAAPLADVLAPDPVAGGNVLTRAQNRIERLAVGGLSGLSSLADTAAERLGLTDNPLRRRLRESVATAQGEHARSDRDEDARRRAQGLPSLAEERAAQLGNRVASGLREGAATLGQMVTPEQQTADQRLNAAANAGVLPLLREVARNPLDATTSVLPSTAAFLVPSALAGRAAGALAGTEAASTAGLLAAGGSAALSTADQASQDVLTLPEAELAKTPQYQALLREGVSPEQARQTLAQRAFNTALPVTSAINAATMGALPQLNVLENLAAGGRLPTGGRLAAALKSGAGELVTEGAQGGGEQLAQNLGDIAAGVRPAEQIFQGVPGQAALEALASGAPATVIGAAMPHTPAEAGAQAAEELLQQAAPAVSDPLPAAAIRAEPTETITPPTPLVQPPVAARTGTEAGQIIDDRLAALQSAAGQGRLIPEQVKRLAREDAELEQLLRSQDKAVREGVRLGPESRLTGEERGFAEARRDEIRGVLGRHKAAQDAQSQLTKLQGQLQKIDQDRDLIALSEQLRPSRAAPAPEPVLAPAPPGPVAPLAAAAPTQSSRRPAPDAALLSQVQASPFARDAVEPIAPLEPQTTPEPAPEVTGAPIVPSAPVLDEAGVARLSTLRDQRRTAALSPQESQEYQGLLEADREAAKVGGQVMPGIRNLTAYREAEQRGQLQPTQAFMDLDNFKAVNDTYGHVMGDEVIAQLGQVLRQAAGDGNVFHRSGDEFTIQGATPAAVRQAAEAARQQLQTTRFRVTLDDGSVRELTGAAFSYGVGNTITEAEHAQSQDKQARKDAGLRTDRREAERRDLAPSERPADELAGSDAGAGPAGPPNREVGSLALNPFQQAHEALQRGQPVEEALTALNDTELQSAARAIGQRFKPSISRAGLLNRLQNHASRLADVLPSLTQEPRLDRRQSPSGIPANLPARKTAATQRLARALNRSLAAGGRAGVPTRFRAIDPTALPEPLRGALDALNRFGQLHTVVVRNLNRAESGVDFNGVTLRDGTLFVDESAQHPALTVAAHEFSHQLEQDAPELYRLLAKEVQRQGRLPEFAANLARRGEAPGREVSELVGDAVGDALSDRAFLETLAQRNPSKFRQLADRFLAYLDSLLGRVRDLGSNAYLRDVQAFRDVLADVMDRFQAPSRQTNEPVPERGQTPNDPNQEPAAFQRRAPQELAETPDLASGVPGTPAQAQTAEQAAPRERATVPEETSLQKAQRIIQDKFNRFRVLQESIELQAAKGAGYIGNDIHAARDYLVAHKVPNPISDATDVYQAETTMSGKIAARAQDFRELQMQPLIQATQQAGFTMAQVADYLKMQHAEEANARARQLHKDESATAYGVTDAEAQAALKAFDQTSPGLKAIANRWREITEQTKNILLDSGILAQDTVDAWENTYTYYVPVKGAESTQPGPGKGLSVNGKIKRRMGHKLRDEAILENILRDHERAIAQDEHNKVGKTLLRFALEIQNPEIVTVNKPVKRQVLNDGVAYEVAVAGSPLRSFAQEKDAKAFAQLDALKSHRSAQDYTISRSTDPHVVLQASPLLAENEVQVYVGGQSVRLQLNDPIAARAYTNLGVEGLNGVLSAAREVNNFLSKMYTGRSPDFLIRNPIRDAIQGSVTLTGALGTAGMARTFAAYPHAAKELVKHFLHPGSSALVSAYRAEGGSTGASYLSDLERLNGDLMSAYNEYAGVFNTYRRVYQDAITKGRSVASAAARASAKAGLAGLHKVPILGHFLTLMEHLNAVTENALRVATFETAQKLKDPATGQHYTPAKAAAMAKNLMNFNRRGEISNQMGALYLFFNPNIQGTEVLLSTLGNSRHKHQARALAGMMVLAGYALAQMARSGGDDDEKRWNQTPDAVKNRNMILQFGGYQFTLPVPYGYGVFHALGNALSDYEHGRDPWEIGLSLSSTLLDNFSPFGNPLDSEHGLFQVIPTLPKMALGPSVNEDSFGRPIVPQRFDDAKPDSQLVNRATKGTAADQLAQGLNRATGGSRFERGAIDVSPETLKFWVNSLTGGAGRFAMDTINLPLTVAQGGTPNVRDIPLARVFVREPGIGDARAAFWAKAQEVDNAVDRVRTALRAKDIPEAKRMGLRDRKLIALGQFSSARQQLIKALRDAQDDIRQDDTLTLPQKDKKMKALEQRERGIYDKFLDQFQHAKE